jgi:hypothetical protein
MGAFGEGLRPEKGVRDLPQLSCLGAKNEAFSE